MTWALIYAFINFVGWSCAVVFCTFEGRFLPLISPAYFACWMGLITSTHLCVSWSLDPPITSRSSHIPATLCYLCSPKRSVDLYRALRRLTTFTTFKRVGRVNPLDDDGDGAAASADGAPVAHTTTGPPLFRLAMCSLMLFAAVLNYGLLGTRPEPPAPSMAEMLYELAYECATFAAQTLN